MRSRSRPPIRVAYDICLMSAGGANGGIKTHHYEFLRHFSERHAEELELWVFCQPEIVEELHFLSASPFNQIHVIGDRGGRDYRDLDGSLPPIHYWPESPVELLKGMGVDLLYCGFGESQLYTPEVPQIALLVDVLHKDLPEMLPPAVVAHRDHVFKQAIERSALIQTNSKFCIESLKRHYNVPEEKLFHIYLPLHGRFNRVEMGALPDCLVGKKYFFYPANHWPHKNHERLLEAYRLYRERAEISSEKWDLALTGYMPGRTEKLQQLARELQVADHVHFLGHLDLPVHKAVWEHCGALVFPSLYEGFGLPILEAMHFQKPIACSNAGSLPEVAGKGVVVFEATSPPGMATALDQLATSSKLSPSPLANFQLEFSAHDLFDRFSQAFNVPARAAAVSS